VGLKGANSSGKTNKGGEMVEQAKHVTRNTSEKKTIPKEVYKARIDHIGGSIPVNTETCEEENNGGDDARKSDTGQNNPSDNSQKGKKVQPGKGSKKGLPHIRVKICGCEMKNLNRK